MEKEVLFTEDLEPPGRVAGGAELHETGCFSTESNHFFLSDSSSQLSLLDSPRWSQRFVATERSRWFRKKFFPQASLSDWNDWHWQISNRILKPAQLEQILRLSPEERRAFKAGGDSLPMAITPYYASLLDPQDPSQALRRTVVPTFWEQKHSPGEAADPLEEDRDSPVKGLVHRYPDRVLFLVTNFCSTYCRYCTRSRMVGHAAMGAINRDQWERALSYIEQTPSVRDVLLSGGDALTLPDEALEWLLGRLSRIPHVEFLRLGTKVPVVLPQRITHSLLRVLKRFHPLWMSIHFTHPEELTPETAQACQRLADAGLPLGSQTVLLRGVNDDLMTMRNLFHGLLRMRVKPYYLYQCDPILGSAHFRTPVSKGLEIIAGLRGHTTGYAVPTYVIDAPGGGGKIPLLPEYLVGRDGDDLILKNYKGLTYRYPDPLPQKEFGLGRPQDRFQRP
ncbi:MAG: KamA family radical SAM protein [bacterium]